jgi:ketosteroid isomerase-like protein
MTEPSTAQSVVRRLLSGMAAGPTPTLADLYAVDAVVELPFAAPGGLLLRGRDEIRRHFARAAGLPLRLVPNAVVLYGTTDPAVVVAEYDYRGEVTGTGHRFVVPNVQVVTVRDGLIQRSRDFHDHAAIAAALTAGRPAPTADPGATVDTAATGPLPASATGRVVADEPDTVPVATGGGDPDDWERRLAAAWAAQDDLDEATFLARIDRLAAEAPTDAVAAFERAGARDSTGHTDLAVPLYRQALDRGLTGPRRRQAVIQMASSLRALGQPEEAVSLLTAELAADSDPLDDAVRAFLALALADTGREREALSLALGALAGHLPRYRRSLRAYARLLVDPSAD